VKVLPPVHINRCIKDPDEFLQSFATKQAVEVKNSNALCAVVRFLCHSPDDVSESLNNTLHTACQNSNGKLLGVASLMTVDIDQAEAEVKKYSDSQFVKAFGVECSALAYQSENYKRIYYLFQLCDSVKRPVFLHCKEDNSLKSACIYAQAVCQIINDGILDYYPELKIIVNSSIIPIVLEELSGNNAGNSLQKQTIDHYLRNNLLCISSCSDMSYLDYLIQVFGDNRILCSPTSTTNSKEDVRNGLAHTFSQLTVQKVMALNAIRLLGISDEEKVWDVNMNRVTVLDKLQCVKLLSSKLRDKNTGSVDFMLNADRLMTVLAEEALSLVPGVKQKDIETPTGVFRGLEATEGEKLCVVSIVRSGDILQEAVRKLSPGIRVGKILIQRDEESEDKRAILYYKKLPKDISDCFVLLVDPMLATGGSAICATDVLIENGVKPENILFVNLFSVEEGLENVQKKFPDMKFITLSIDDYMNDAKYIVPGVGDFGDRYYGTTD
jgi:uracil phosphoribosyltransferase